jgi:membrane-bound lytic murein transglycosylase D
VVVVPERRFDLPGRRRVFYRVLTGDTISEIARAFSVTSSELAAFNALDEAARLQADMTLQVFVARNADLSRVRFLEEKDVRVIVAGSADFIDYFEAQNGRKRITVLAKDGDTLSSLGKRYGMSAGMMERINRYSRSKKLTNGEPVVVYAKREVPVESAGLTNRPSPLSPIEAPNPEALPGAPTLGAPQASNGRRAVLP